MGPTSKSGRGGKGREREGSESKEKLREGGDGRGTERGLESFTTYF